MDDIKLSKEADALICLIYKYYLELCNSGISKSISKSLGSSLDIHTNIISKWSFEDIDNTCKKLGNANLLFIDFADDICYEIELTDSGIVYMENRFNNKIKTLLDYLDKIKFW